MVSFTPASVLVGTLQGRDARNLVGTCVGAQVVKVILVVGKQCHLVFRRLEHKAKLGRLRRLLVSINQRVRNAAFGIGAVDAHVGQHAQPFGQVEYVGGERAVRVRFGGN